MGPPGNRGPFPLRGNFMLTSFKDPLPAGTILDFAGSTVPDGYLDCDGSAVSRTTYADLFNAIGTTYGVGDGSTTFNLPDCRGRSSLGAGTGSGLTARSLAATGGTETHTLTSAQIPAHKHPTLTTSGTFMVVSGAGAFGFGAGANGPAADATTGDNTGGGGSHPNMHPFIVFKKIIKAFYPS